MQKSTLTALRAGAAPLALAVALAGAPAFAQDTPAPVTTVSAEDVEEAEGDNVILVTGSILRRTDAETPSPVTVLSAETLEERGINTVAEAVQRLSANNAGTIQQGWNTGFNFATRRQRPGAARPDRAVDAVGRRRPAHARRIRSRTTASATSSTSTPFPSAIVERIEVLRDGASSTYGADAIAGVINVITKKEIQGLHLGGSFGMSAGRRRRRKPHRR